MTIRTVLYAVPALIFGWIVVMTAVMYFSDAAPAAVVLFPKAGFVGRLPGDASILAASRLTVTVASDAPSLGAALYRAGGRLVLPAGLTGCLPLPGR